LEEASALAGNILMDQAPPVTFVSDLTSLSFIMPGRSPAAVRLTAMPSDSGAAVCDPLTVSL